MVYGYRLTGWHFPARPSISHASRLKKNVIDYLSAGVCHWIDFSCWFVFWLRSQSMARVHGVMMFKIPLRHYTRYTTICVTTLQALTRRDVPLSRRPVTSEIGSLGQWFGSIYLSIRVVCVKRSDDLKFKDTYSHICLIPNIKFIYSVYSVYSAAHL